MKPPRDENQEPDLGHDVQFRDVTPAIEFICWTVVVLGPLLRWVNGPAVTDDQFMIQVGLVSCAALGVVGLRVYNWRSKRPNY